MHSSLLPKQSICLYAAALWRSAAFNTAQQKSELPKQQLAHNSQNNGPAPEKSGGFSRCYNLQTRNGYAGDLNASMLLTVPGVPTRILAATQQLDFQLRALLCGNLHLTSYHGTLDQRSTDDTGTAAVRQQNAVKGDRCTLFNTFAIVNRQERALLYPMLTITVFNHSKHESKTPAAKKQKQHHKTQLFRRTDQGMLPSRESRSVA
jgi:hypothetical protein